MASEKALIIREIFRSIQGESTWQGLPCVFIRLTGCNLQCSYCDTSYAREGGERLTDDEIIARVKLFNTQLVEVTGGEPLLQTGCGSLLSRLVAEGFTVMLETNGSRDLSAVNAEVIKIVDIKCPGSGMGDSFDFNNLNFLGPRDEIKFVLSDRRDFNWACELAARHDLLSCHTVLFAPVSGSLEASELVAWILQDHVPVRLNLQLHKYIWGKDTKN